MGREIAREVTAAGRHAGVINMRLQDFIDLTWEEDTANPLIEPARTSLLIADPTFLPPAETPDGNWHLFAHSLCGLQHFRSTDGVAWRQFPGRVAPGGIRPYLFCAPEAYCLFYERLLSVVPLHTRIEMMTSTDLSRWSRPVSVLEPALAWQGEGGWRGTVGNPCLIAEAGGYRLFFSAGLVFLPDCKFFEPKYIGTAFSPRLTGPYEPLPEPILAPSPADEYGNLGAGALKVVRASDGYLGFQNGIYWDDASGHSRSAIRLLTSADGLSWRPVPRVPILRPGQGWKRSHIYALDVRLVAGAWWVYFNARDGWVLGRERIGRAVGVQAGPAAISRAAPQPAQAMASAGMSAGARREGSPSGAGALPSV